MNFFQRLCACSRQKTIVAIVVAVVVLVCVAAIVTPVLILTRSKTSTDPAVSTTVFSTDK